MKKSVVIIGLLIVLGAVGYYFVSGGGGENFQGLLRKTTRPATSATTTATTTQSVPTVTLENPVGDSATQFVVDGKQYGRNLFTSSYVSSDPQNTYVYVLPANWVKTIIDNGPPYEMGTQRCAQKIQSIVDGTGLKCKFENLSAPFMIEYEWGKTAQYRIFAAILDASGKEVATSQQYYVP